MTTGFKERQLPLRIALPLDVDHDEHCFYKGNGGLAYPAIGQTPISWWPTMPDQKCPGCCYERGYKDAIMQTAQQQQSHGEAMGIGEIVCGICGQEHPDFRSAWGHWCDHLKAGDEMKDWIEVSKEMVKEKT